MHLPSHLNSPVHLIELKLNELMHAKINKITISQSKQKVNKKDDHLPDRCDASIPPSFDHALDCQSRKVRSCNGRVQLSINEDLLDKNK